MSGSARFGAAAMTAACLALVPAVATAHAIGGTFQLPVPLWLYLLGAAVAVAASFVVTSVVTRAGGRGYATRPVPVALAASIRTIVPTSWRPSMPPSSPRRIQPWATVITSVPATVPITMPAIPSGL